MVIPREAGRTTYSTEIRELKKRLVLDKDQRAIVIGSILGDGCLCENWSKTNYRLKISHSVKQQDYILWKYRRLKDWILTEPKIYERTKSVSIRTVSHSELTVLQKIFYRNKKKVIPKNIKELLNPLAIAIWFMDDGNIARKQGKVSGYNINTQSFSFQEQQLLVKALNDTWKLSVVIERNRGKYRLGIYARSGRESFANLIGNLIIPSLKYKIG